ncbi:MAG: DUF87 domain-containing protein [Truepera sp.]|nr:DUF87 domain-containing protein [Truepera sp.]
MVLETSASESTSLLEGLKQSAGQPTLTPFRNRAKLVGSVYTISYTSAVVAVYDYDREQAGGLPKNAFLMAAKLDGDKSFILLRIQNEARLPAAAANDQTRQESIEDSGNQGSWADRLPNWVKDKISLHGLECSVLGTFIAREDGTYRYAEDIANYYAVNELMVWKPDAESLNLIVNHQHRTNDIPIARKAAKIGRTRFAAADSDNATIADFRINPTDIMKRRTAYFGMSRSGKSNGLKIVAENIYRIREDNPEHRVGQVIFDLSGEYAQDNYQDGKGLHRVHETIGLPRQSEVATYGLIPVDWDKCRNVMKLNFFGDQIPRDWQDDQDTRLVEQALDQMLAGKEIIKGIMANETARYTTAFRDADLTVQPTAAGDMSAKTRYYRAVLAYRTALAAAGLQTPEWEPTIRGPGLHSMFSKDLIDALHRDKNTSTDNQTDYHQAATILQAAVNNQFKITWDQLITVFTALSRFIEDKRGHFDTFEQRYITNVSRSHESWADPRFRAVLRIFESRNGPRTFQRVREQHDPGTTNDFAEAVVEDLRQGKLVVIDQSAGDPEQNQAAAERIMWRIFRSQQDRFRSVLAQHDPSAPPDASQATKGHIIIYIEEAHNLLPRANARDNLTTVWARAAKEGSKLNIGMVLATQAPSSVMPEILSETDNWVLSYLNSGAERRVVADYMDFADFIDQIGRVSEQGFVRIRTLSQAYTVPVQLDKFSIEDEDVGNTTDPSQSTFQAENGHSTEQPPL